MKNIYFLPILLFLILFTINSIGQLNNTNHYISDEQNRNIQTIHLNFSQPDGLKIETNAINFNILKGKLFHSINLIKISGGSGKYQYSWKFNPWNHNYNTPNISVSPPDTTNFILQVRDEKGCTETEIFKINVIFPMQVESKITDAGCFGDSNGAIELSISKGAPPYNFKWSNGSTTSSISELKAGIYQVIVSDSMGQIFNKEFEIKEFQPLQTNLFASICQGETYSFGNKEYSETGHFSDTLTTITGCDSIIDLTLTLLPSYRDTIKTIQCAEDYSFHDNYPFYPSGFLIDSLLTTNGCDSLIVNNVTISLVMKPTIKIVGDTLKSNASPLCLWYKNGVPISEANNSKYIIKSSGTYMVYAFSEFGCKVASDNVSITYSDTYQLNDNYFDCTVFPNPNNGLFTLKLKSKQTTEIKLQLISPEGKNIFSKTIDATQNEMEIPISFEHLQKGIYLLKATAGRNIFIKKIIFQ